MLDIGQQQFGMLLLMREAQRNKIGQRGIVQQRCHGCIDMGTPVEDLRHAGPRQHAATAPRNPRAFGLVIGIEQERPVGVEQAIAGPVIAQQEGLPEPRRMRQMPLGGRGILHRLDGGIGLAERGGERLAQLPGGGIAPGERGRCRVGLWRRAGLGFGQNALLLAARMRVQDRTCPRFFQPPAGRAVPKITPAVLKPRGGPDCGRLPWRRRAPRRRGPAGCPHRPAAPCRRCRPRQ